MGTTLERVQVLEADPGSGDVVPAAERPAARRAVVGSVEQLPVHGAATSMRCGRQALWRWKGCIAGGTVTTTLHRPIEASLLGHESSVGADTLVPLRN